MADIALAFVALILWILAGIVGWALFVLLGLRFEPVHRVYVPPLRVNLARVSESTSRVRGHAVATARLHVESARPARPVPRRPDRWASPLHN